MINKSLTFSFRHSDQMDKIYEKMTSQEIKAAFDSRGNDLLNYIYYIIDDLKTITGSQNIGYKETTVYGALDGMNMLTTMTQNEISNAREGKSTLLLNLQDIRTLLSQKASSTHTHNEYSLTSHSHAGYSLTSHNHSGTYADAFHVHTGLADKTHTHVKADTTDFAHTHTKTEIVDFPLIPMPYTLPIATASTLGGVKAGSNITIDGTGVISTSAPYSLPTASASTLGGVKIGTGLSISSGVLSSTPYTLPIATASTLGGVKAGSNITIDANGVISTHAPYTYTLPIATASTLGGVKAGTNITIDANGVISSTGGSGYTLPIASTTVLGGVKAGTNISIDANGVISASSSAGSDWTAITNKPTFATVSTTGSYTDLLNKPTIPTVTNDLTAALKTNYDSAYTHSTSAHAPSTAQPNSAITKAEIEAKLTGAITTHTHSYEPANSNIQTHVISAHAPSTAQKNSDITKAEIEAKLTGAITTHTHSYAPTSHTHSTSNITDFPTLSTIATSGNFNDLVNIPMYSVTLSANNEYLSQFVIDANVTAIQNFIQDTRPGNKLLLGIGYNPTPEFKNEDLYLCSNAYISEEEQTAEFSFSKTSGGTTNGFPVLYVTTYKIIFNMANSTYTVSYVSYSHNLGDFRKNWSGTLASYNAITTKDSNTVYYITG